MEEVKSVCEKCALVVVKNRLALDEKFKQFQEKLSELSIPNATPVKNSKRVKNVSPIKESEEDSTDISIHSDTVPLRPVRTARLKATNSMKEPALNSKLRRPATNVKKELASDDSKENQAPNTYNDGDGEDQGAVGGAPKRKSDDTSPEAASIDVAKKLSVEHIPMEEVKIEILSDNDDAGAKMPPPPVPPKKVGRPKKAVNESVRSTRSKIKEERSSTVAEQPRAARVTRTKSKKKAEEEAQTLEETQTKPVVKVEKLSLEQVIAATTSPPTRPNSANSKSSSVYEDAIEAHSQPKTSDSTFAKPQPPAETTFTKTTTPNATFAVAGNETFQVESPTEANGTYILPLSKKNSAANPHDSIMTEDRSDEEFDPPPPIPLKSAASEPIFRNGKQIIRTHELFNPTLQSPVKARVQAFEKMATPSYMSPTQGKLRSKFGTPGEHRPSRLGGNANRGILQAASSVPLLLTRAATSSASKLAHVQKKTGAIPKSQSLSRENSADDMKKFAAEEKKKKREERQRLVQQQREQLELDKRSKAEALLKEKDERVRKHKQQLEEQQRVLKLQEQKREELIRLEQLKRMEQQQMEAIRSKQNESLQRKAIQKRMASKQAREHEFSILQTDDSTDDEGKMNKRRPLPPAWSKGAQKRLQIQFQSKPCLALIDTFFSSQPTTIDLKEIFPTIDERKLKRNSSAVWRTPPRHSTMPKY